MWYHSKPSQVSQLHPLKLKSVIHTRTQKLKPTLNKIQPQHMYIAKNINPKQRDFKLKHSKTHEYKRASKMEAKPLSTRHKVTRLQIIWGKCPTKALCLNQASCP